jgi:hypothetical protein
MYTCCFKSREILHPGFAACAMQFFKPPGELDFGVGLNDFKYKVGLSTGTILIAFIDEIVFSGSFGRMVRLLGNLTHSQCLTFSTGGQFSTHHSAHTQIYYQSSSGSSSICSRRSPSVTS